MDVEASLTEFFAHHIELVSSAALDLPGELDQAGLTLANCLLADNKILTCGDGIAGHTANMLADYLVGGFLAERPELPCISLSANTHTGDGESAEIYSRQIKALGQAGDTLLVFTTGKPSELLFRTVLAARDKEITTILLDFPSGSDCGSLLGDQDIQLVLPADTRPQLMELHICIVHILCKLIDYYIFGEEGQYEQ